MSEALAMDGSVGVTALPARPGYWGSVGVRLRRDPVTVVVGLMLLLIILSAVFTPLLAPFDPYEESISLGRAIVDRDVPVLHWAILCLSLVLMVTNVLVDVLQVAIDPRLRRA